MQPTTEQLDELVRRIVRAVNPLRIILFGSAVRGEMGPNSDIDLLVVMPEGTHCRETSRYLHQQLFGYPYPVDILVTTPAILEQYGDATGRIYKTVLHEGRDVYAA